MVGWGLHRMGLTGEPAAAAIFSSAGRVCVCVCVCGGGVLLCVCVGGGGVCVRACVVC